MATHKVTIRYEVAIEVTVDEGVNLDQIDPTDIIKSVDDIEGIELWQVSYLEKDTTVNGEVDVVTV